MPTRTKTHHQTLLGLPALVEDFSEDQSSTHELAEELLEHFRAEMHHPSQDKMGLELREVAAPRGEDDVLWGAELSEEMDRLLAAQLNPSDQSHDFRVPSEDRGLDDAPSARWLRKSVTVLRAQSPSPRTRSARPSAAPSGVDNTPPLSILNTKRLAEDLASPNLAAPVASQASPSLSFKAPSPTTTGPFVVPSAQRQTQDSAQIWISRAPKNSTLPPISTIAPVVSPRANFEARRLTTEDLARLFQQTDRALAQPELDEPLVVQHEPTAEYTEADLKAILQNPDAHAPEAEAHPKGLIFVDVPNSDDATREHVYPSPVDEVTRKVTPALRAQALDVAELHAARRKLRRGAEAAEPTGQNRDLVAELAASTVDAPVVYGAPLAQGLGPSSSARQAQRERVAALHARSERLMAERKVVPASNGAGRAGLGPSLGSAALALVAGAQAVAPAGFGWPGGAWASLVPLCCAAVLLVASFGRVSWQLRLTLGISAGGALACFAALPAFFHALGFFQAWAWGVPHALVILSLAGFARAIHSSRA